MSALVILEPSEQLCREQTVNAEYVSGSDRTILENRFQILNFDTNSKLCNYFAHVLNADC